MKNKRNLLKIILGVLVVLFSLLFGFDIYQDQSELSDVREIEEVEAEEVIDGDTIRVKALETGEVFNVRYLGIDTPELEGPGYETCFYSQAKEKNEELVLDKKLLLEFDIDKYDRFGRTLAYVYVLDEQGEKETFVNLELLQKGFARFYLDNQNTLYQDEFVQAALSAQEDFLGIWGSCGESQFDGKCVIKGNVARHLEDRKYRKYYHVPGDRYYSKTIVNLIYEDQWLCSIEEAEAKNFHRAEQ
ncbi:hypothetical protein AMJ49_05695 [Parcubacteria bacterium DG_74_2]|nr:MAG: hypothetical protein AMJ49_05695 [Parcubacteria bacterium DG_74_2]